VPDLPAMFSQLRRVLKAGGQLGIVTESYAQIEGRVYNRYFPSLAGNEKQRYPDLPVIVESALAGGLSEDGKDVYMGSPVTVISEAFVRNVEEKNYSMFRRLEEAEFQEGLKRIKEDTGQFFEQNFGEMCLWFRRSVNRESIQDNR